MTTIRMIPKESFFSTNNLEMYHNDEHVGIKHFLKDEKRGPTATHEEYYVLYVHGRDENDESVAVAVQMPPETILEMAAAIQMQSSPVWREEVARLYKMATSRERR